METTLLDLQNYLGQYDDAPNTREIAESLIEMNREGFIEIRYDKEHPYDKNAKWHLWPTDRGLDAFKNMLFSVRIASQHTPERYQNDAWVLCRIPRNPMLDSIRATQVKKHCSRFLLPLLVKDYMYHQDPRAFYIGIAPASEQMKESLRS